MRLSTRGKDEAIPVAALVYEDEKSMGILKNVDP
jgi:hypothetical protein